MGDLVNGIFLGGVYTTVALGLTLVFGVMRLVNLAHGELLVGGGFLAYSVMSWLGVGPLVALAVVVPLVAAIGYPLQRYVLNPLMPHGMEAPLVATFGLSVVAQMVLTLVYTSDPKSLSASYGETSVHVAGQSVRSVFVIALVAAVILVVGLHLALTRLRVGRALRAAAERPAVAATMGIDVAHVYALTFALAAGLAAVGGVIIGVAFSLTPTTGVSWLLRGFTVIVLGGMGSVWGTLAGGIALGVAQQYAATAFGPQYTDLVVFLLLVAVLVLRPQGLLGKRVLA
jgi:branched-chain amino acid transport system permease protein